MNDAREDALIDAARVKIAAGEMPTKEEANAYFAASLFNATNQVYFRAGLIACREYMATFVEAQSPEIAASIRANWWPKLGPDFGPPRQMRWEELVEGGADEPPIKCRDDISPTLEALPIALQFLQTPEPGPLVCARRVELAPGVPAAGLGDGAERRVEATIEKRQRMQRLADALEQAGRAAGPHSVARQFIGMAQQELRALTDGVKEVPRG